MVVDYRELNKVTVRKFFLIPNSDYIKSTVAGNEFISVGDLTKSNQVVWFGADGGAVAGENVRQEIQGVIEKHERHDLWASSEAEEMHDSW